MELNAQQLRQRGESVRIVIADDHEIARSGLRSMLAPETDLEVVGEAKDGLEAVELCRMLRPDLVFMDVQMRRMGGLAATRQIKEEVPDTSVIMLTVYESPRYLLEALKVGAAGYILKEASKCEVVAAIRKVLCGEALPKPEFTARQIQQLAAEKTQDSVKPPPKPMTPRELEILHYLAEGQTNREIAQRLVVSTATVKVHVAHIIAKLGVSDRTQAAVRAVTLGLLSTPKG